MIGCLAWMQHWVWLHTTAYKYLLLSNSEFTPCNPLFGPPCHFVPDLKTSRISVKTLGFLMHFSLILCGYKCCWSLRLSIFQCILFFPFPFFDLIWPHQLKINHTNHKEQMRHAFCSLVYAVHSDNIVFNIFHGQVLFANSLK